MDKPLEPRRSLDECENADEVMQRISLFAIAEKGLFKMKGPEGWIIGKTHEELYENAILLWKQRRMRKVLRIENDPQNEEDVLIDLMTIARKSESANQLIPWIEGLSTEERQGLYSLLSTTTESGQVSEMNRLWETRVDIT
jgi:hypothetical protein